MRNYRPERPFLLNLLQKSIDKNWQQSSRDDHFAALRTYGQLFRMDRTGSFGFMIPSTGGR
jgi:hypothetical protein